MIDSLPSIGRMRAPCHRRTTETKTPPFSVSAFLIRAKVEPSSPTVYVVISAGHGFFRTFSGQSIVNHFFRCRSLSTRRDREMYGRVPVDRLVRPYGVVPAIREQYDVVIPSSIHHSRICLHLPVVPFFNSSQPRHPDQARFNRLGKGKEGGGWTDHALILICVVRTFLDFL